MSTPIAMNNILQVRFCCFLTDQVAFNVRHYVVTALTGTITDVDCAAAINAVFATAYRNLLCTAANFQGLDVQIIGEGGATPVPVINTDGAGAGASSADPLPRQTCGLISLRTGFTGRSFRGRAYIPFPSEAANSTGGKPGAAYVGDLETLRDTMIATLNPTAALSSATIAPAILQTGSNTTAFILTGIARQIWATQRRRGDYGRPNTPPF